jgi:hypothetical protein
MFGLGSVRLNDKKKIELITINEKKHEFSYGLDTPPVEKGYQGIANKAIGNAILSIGGPVSGAITKGIGVVTEGVGAVGCVALGTLGLIATPAILVKDLTHHTYRVLSQKCSESGL